MEEPITTAPSVEGSPEGTGSQVADSSVQGETQADNQVQETDKPQVEGSGQQTSSEGAGRPKTSDFFHKREREKRRFFEIENQVKQLREQLQSLGSKQQAPAPPKPEEKLDYDTFSKQFWDTKSSPDKFMFEYLQKMEKKIQENYDNRIKEFKEKDLMESLTQLERNKEFQREQQESLEVLFPKDEKNPNLTLEQRIEMSQDKLAKLDEIEKREGLTGMFERNPKQAVNLLMKLYNYEMANNKNPNAPKKSQMGSIVTGTPIGRSGGKGSMTLNEIMAEKSKLDRALDENPKIRFEPKFKEQRAKIIEMFEQREKELSGQTA